MTTKHIDRLLADTASLGEPGDVQAGDYVRKPGGESADKAAGMVVSDLASAGWSILYDTITREPSTVNNNMKSAQLGVRREDGTLVFTEIKPPEGPRRGNIKCFLHKDQPDRAKYAAMGFAACRKNTLPNQFQAENHARHKHREEWRAVEAEREARERSEDRAAQLAMVRAVGNATVGSSFEAVAPAAVATVAPVVEAVAGSPVQRSGECSQCEWYSSAKKSGARKNSLKQHIARAHGGGA